MKIAVKVPRQEVERKKLPRVGVAGKLEIETQGFRLHAGLRAMSQQDLEVARLLGVQGLGRLARMPLDKESGRGVGNATDQQLGTLDRNDPVFVEQGLQAEVTDFSDEAFGPPVVFVVPRNVEDA